MTCLPTLNAPMVTKFVCFSRLLESLRSSMANSVDPDQTAPIRAVCSGSTLFASILNSSVKLGNYLQQTTSADNIFRCIFLGALGVNIILDVEETQLTNSCSIACPHVRGGNLRTLASGLSYVQVDKRGLTIVYHLP